MTTPNHPPSPAVRDRLQRVRHLFLDMDGTLYRGQQLLPNTRPFLDQLQALNIGRTFLTNNCSLAPANYLAKLERLGIPASLGDIVTSMHSAVHFLKTHHPQTHTLYVVGTDDLRDQLALAGFQILRDTATALPDMVVLGYSAELSYANLCKAAWWISQGSPYIATHPDPHCPTDADTLMIDCGALTRCVQTATDVSPTAVLGKPHPLMLEPVMQRLQLKPEEVAVVGDRLGTDVAMGRAVGAMGILVMTGATDAQQLADADAPPDLAVADLGALADVLSTL